MHYKVERNATWKEFGRELSLKVFVVSNNKTRTVLGTDAHSSVLYIYHWCHCVTTGVSVVSRLEKWPHKRFAYRHALEHDYSGYGGRFLRARVCSLFQACHLLIVFSSVTLGEEALIFVPLTFTERGTQIQTCLISLDGNPSSGKLATSEKITSIELTSAHIIER